MSRTCDKARAAWLALMVAGGVARVVAAADAPVTVGSASLPVFSAYVWRGQVLNDEPVVQPGVTLSKGGFSFNTWGNYNLTDAVSADTENEMSEVDVTASYSHSFGPVALGIGIVQYMFPGQTVSAPDVSYAALNTREVYVSAGMPDVLLAPALTVYRDVDEVDGFYASLGVGHSFELSERVSLSLGFSMGGGDAEYNTIYFGVADTKLNDGNVSLGLPIKINDLFTVTPLVQYTWLWDSDLEDAAGVLYKDDSLVWGGVTLSMSF